MVKLNNYTPSVQSSDGPSKSADSSLKWHMRFFYALLYFFSFFMIMVICLSVKNREGNSLKKAGMDKIFNDAVKGKPADLFKNDSFGFTYNTKMIQNIEAMLYNFYTLKKAKKSPVVYEKSKFDPTVLALDFVKNAKEIVRDVVPSDGSCGYHAWLFQFLEIIRGTEEQRKKYEKTKYYNLFFNEEMMLKSYTPVIVNFWMPVAKRTVAKYSRTFMELEPRDLYGLVVYLRLVLCAYLNEEVKNDTQFIKGLPEEYRDAVFCDALSLTNWIDAVQYMAFGKFFEVSFYIFGDTNGFLKNVATVTQPTDQPTILLIWVNKNHYEPGKIVPM